MPGNERDYRKEAESMQALLTRQLPLLSLPAGRLAARAIKRTRGRPRRQEPVLAVFEARLRAGLTDQSEIRERHKIARGWSGPNVPSDRTIKRAISHLHQELHWLDGTVTEQSAIPVLRQITGQK